MIRAGSVTSRLFFASAEHYRVHGLYQVHNLAAGDVAYALAVYAREAALAVYAV